jgi:hypothetical protein
MTDQQAPTYAPPRWRVAATFAATDGRTPETIEVESNADDVDGVTLIAGVIQELASVAAHRNNWMGPASITSGPHANVPPEAAAAFLNRAAAAEKIGAVR